VKLLTVLLLTSVAFAACSPKEGADVHTSTPAGQDATPTPTETAIAGLRWEDCFRDYECATLEVPLDYSGKVPGTMDVPLVRVPAIDRSERIGVLVVNPGGPGGSGVEYVASSAEFWPEELRRFDIIGFDPRGVSGRTAVDCTDDLDEFYAVDSSPDTSEERAEIVRVYEEFARACEERSGEYLPFLGGTWSCRTSISSGRRWGGADLVHGVLIRHVPWREVRRSLSGRVRAFALDGATDPQLAGADWQKQQALGFEAALDAFLADCAARPACAFHSEGEPAAAFDRLMGRIEVERLAVGRRSVGPERPTWRWPGRSTQRSGWPLLATALAAAVEGDGSELLDLADRFVNRNPDGTYDDFVEIYRSISCVDLDFPDDVAGFEAMAADLRAVAPRFGATLAYEHLDCVFWATEAAEPRAVRAAGARPSSLLGPRGPGHAARLGGVAREPARVGRAAHARWGWPRGLR
jgi:pimeloyl-ACP methyl ester carboxylesterase